MKKTAAIPPAIRQVFKFVFILMLPVNVVAEENPTKFQTQRRN